MNQDHLKESGCILAEMRLRIEGIEGMILLYEEDTLVLHDLAEAKKLYHASGALDAIAAALYDLRTQIINLQSACRNAECDA